MGAEIAGWPQAHSAPAVVCRYPVPADDATRLLSTRYRHYHGADLRVCASGVADGAAMPSGSLVSHSGL